MHSDYKNHIAKVFDQFSEAYAKKFGDAADYTQELDFLISMIDAGQHNLIDLGSGPGNLSSYIYLRKNGLNITCVDMAKGMLDIAGELMPEATLINAPALSIKSMETRFDIFLLGFILPYLNGKELSELLITIDSKSNNNALLYISWINNKNYPDGNRELVKNGVNMKQFFYTHEYICHLLEASNWLILKSYDKGDFLNDENDSEYVLIAKKIN